MLKQQFLRSKSHPCSIVHILNSDYGVGPWWQQMVTVTYENERGLRDRHEKPEGYHGKTSLEINFYSKSASASQVVVQHSKLPDAKAAAKMKTYWGEALDRMRDTLE